MADCCLSLCELQDAAYQLSREKGFWPEAGTQLDSLIPEKLMLITTELAEALEEVRAGHSPTEVYYNPDKPAKPEGFGIELADAMIRIADLAEAFGVDLWDCIDVKMQYNKTRPYKHGKQF